MNSLPVRLFHGSLFGIFLGALTVSMFHGIQQRFQKPPEMERVVEIDNDAQTPSTPAASQGTPTPDDLDGDGIPNTWETANSMNPNNPSDAESDFDFDGLSAFEEYELSVATNNQYGKPLGTYALTTLPLPSGFATNTSGVPIISSVTVIESAPNGVILASVVGRLQGQTSNTTTPFTYNPATGQWTRLRRPSGVADSVVLYATDLNARGQVVGYYIKSGYKGFIWTPDPSHPEGGVSEPFFINPQSATPTAAIPKRISNTGHTIYSVGYPTATLCAADPDRCPVDPFSGAWSTPIYVDVNDYGEFVGLIGDPVTWRIKTFLAIPNGPVFLSAPSAFDYNQVFNNYYSNQAYYSLNAPDVDFDAIVWDTTDPYAEPLYGTAVDRTTQAVVEFRKSYGVIWWNAWSDGNWYSQYGDHWVNISSSETPACVNDWGEFAGVFNQTTEELEETFEGDSYFSTWGGQGVFWFGGDYRMTLTAAAVYGISNDPQILLGTSKPTHLWSDSLIVPFSKLFSPLPTYTTAKLADNGVLFFQKDAKTIQRLAPSDDADQDGMPDDWEAYHGLDPSLADAHLDSDGDGVNNFLEFVYRSNPIGVRNGIDNDGDGMPNPWEVLHGLNPNDSSDAATDADQDGLSNLQEFKLGTDPNESDSDYDGMRDGWEASFGLDPRDNGSKHPRNGSAGDADGDGVPNGDEYTGDGDPSDPNDFPVQVIKISNVAQGWSEKVEEDYNGSSGYFKWNSVAWQIQDLYQEATPACLMDLLTNNSGDPDSAFPTMPPDPDEEDPDQEIPGVYRSNLNQATLELSANQWLTADQVSRHGGVELARFWIRAPASSVQRKISLLKTTTKTVWPIGMAESNDPEIVSVEEVSFTIDANTEYSQPVDVKALPEATAGASVDWSVGLLESGIVSDTNRDGKIDQKSDLEGKDSWTADTGAIFSVNFDRDGNLSNGNMPATDAITWWSTEGVPEHEDWSINGELDEQDITPVTITVPSLPVGSKAYLVANEAEDVRSIHLFPRIKNGRTAIWGGFQETGRPWSDTDSNSLDVEITQWLNSAADSSSTGGSEIERGTYVFGIEGLLFRGMPVPDGSLEGGRFSGVIDLELEISIPGVNARKKCGRVTLKVAPFLMTCNDRPTDTVYVSNIESGLQGISSKTTILEYGAPNDDQWIQDHAEIGYTQRPGGPKMKIALTCPRDGGLAVWPRKRMLSPGKGVFALGSNLGGGGGDYGGIKVGTPVARRPPCRSRRAELPHRAPQECAQVEFRS